MINNNIELVWEDINYEFMKYKEREKETDFRITFRIYLKCRKEESFKVCKYSFLLFKIREDVDFDPDPKDELNVKF
jgi:hypothetical protein